MTLGSLGSFQYPYIEYYEDMLKNNIRTQLIYDSSDDDAKDRLENILKLKEIYFDKIKIKSSPSFYGTSRKFIYENLAIDGRKILLADPKLDLCYISTIYLGKEKIEHLRRSFNEAWIKATEVWTK
jgi:hypothetical protein